MEKKTLSFGHCPNHLTPPLTQFRQLGPFFSDVKIQDLKVTKKRFAKMWGGEGDILTT